MISGKASTVATTAAATNSKIAPIVISAASRTVPLSPKQKNPNSQQGQNTKKQQHKNTNREPQYATCKFTS